MEGDLKYSLVDRRDKKTLASCQDIIKAAFSDYPLLQAVPTKDPAAFSDAVISVWCKALRRNTVLAARRDGQIVAVAELQAPSDKGYSDAQYRSLSALRARRCAGKESWQDFKRLCSLAGAACETLPDPRWHLCLLAVDASQKGGGIGSRMLHECLLPYISAHGGGVLTFNTNAEVNRRFYLKNGFEEFDARVLRVGELQIGDWCYRRTVDPK